MIVIISKTNDKILLTKLRYSSSALTRSIITTKPRDLNSTKTDYFHTMSNMCAAIDNHTESDVELTFDTESCGNWSNTMVKKLYNAVYYQLPKSDFWKPYDQATIDWEEVGKTIGYEAEKCRLKWAALLKTVRTYRTGEEILLDLHTQYAKMDIKKMNTEIRSKHKAQQKTPQVKSPMIVYKKKKGNPDHPKKPMTSGYTLFCQKVGSEQEETGMKKFLKLSQLWKSLTAEEKQMYDDEVSQQKQNYHFAVTQYAMSHPEDEEIKFILSELNSSKNSRKRRRSPKTIELSDTTITVESDHENSSYSSCKSSVQKDDEKPSTSGTAAMGETASRKRKLSHPRTAVGVYIKENLEMFMENHPDLSKDQCVRKLKKKFRKLSGEKMAKYEAKFKDQN